MAKKVKKTSTSKKVSLKKVKVEKLIKTKLATKKNKSVAKPAAKPALAKKTSAKISATKKTMTQKLNTKKSSAKKSSAKKTTTKKASALGRKPHVLKTRTQIDQEIKLKANNNIRLNQSKKQKTSDLTNIVTPLDDRIFIELKHAERKTAGGLYIPDTVADVSGNLQGFVVCVGRGHLSKKGHLRPMDLRIGDQVVFSEHAGQKIEISNQEFIILREADVLGVITP